MALTTIPSELSSVSGISDSSTSTAITIDSSQNVTFAGNITTGSNTISGVLSSVTGSLGSAATATTQAASDNSTKLATTAYVTTALANMVDSAPSTLNTLNELAAALGDDANFSTTVTNSIATKLPLAGGTLTGDINFGDNDKAIFGAGSDLQIYSDGTNSFIKETAGAGSLIFNVDFFTVQNAAGTETKLVAKDNAEVELYYDNLVKLETTSTGIDVTGAIDVSGVAQIGGSTDLLYLSGKTGTHAYVSLGANNTAADFFIGADTAIPLIFRTSATERMRIDASGNVGIGQSVPYNSSKLDVVGSIISTSQTIALYAADNAGFDFAAGTKIGRFFSTSSDATGGHMTFITGAGGGAERMRIDSGGNVLVGRTNPSFGNTGHTLAPSGFVYHERDGGDSVMYLNRLTSDGDIIRFYRDSNTQVGSIGARFGDLTIGTGNCGLIFNDGTEIIIPANITTNAVSDAAVDLGYSAGRFKHLYLSGDVVLGSADGYVFGNTDGVNIRASSGKSTIFQTAGSERMRIDASGNVGIGVVPESWLSSYSALQIGASGALSAITSGNENVGLSSNTYLATDGNFKYIATNEATRYLQSAGVHYWYTAASGTADTNVSFSQNMTLDASGRLLVAQTSAVGIGGAPADVNGAEIGKGYINLNRDDTASAHQIQFGKNGFVAGRITTTTTTSYVETSDRRVKSNIADAEDCGTAIDSMQVRKFDWTESGEHHPFGMIAQELLEIAPIAVDAPDDPSEMMGIDYSKLVPMLVKEIQSLRARVQQLENN